MVFSGPLVTGLAGRSANFFHRFCIQVPYLALV